MKSAAKPAHDAASKRRKPATRKAGTRTDTLAPRQTASAEAALAPGPEEANVVTVTHGSPRDICGADSVELASVALTAAVEALLPWGPPGPQAGKQLAPAALDLLLAAKPADPLELAVIVGIQAAQSHGLRALRLSMSAHDSESYLRYVAASTRLLRSAGELLEALARYRGKESSQKVTVEHVYVAPGAQAFVGVAAPGGSPAGVG